MEDIDILCLNCENMISSDKIMSHSAICTAPTVQILKLTHSTTLQNLNFRLDKLKCAIDSILYDHTKVLTTDEKMMLVYLSRHLSEAISLSSIDSDTENWTICENLSKKIQDYPQAYISNCISIYLERALLLIQHKAEAYKEKPNQIFVEPFDNLMKQKHSIRNYTDKLSIKSKINEVGMVVDEIKNRLSVACSGVSDSEVRDQDEIGELELMVFENEKRMNLMSNEELQKYFYSKCLVAKLAFGSRDPVQFLQIPELFRKTKELGISIDMWDDFINDQFSQVRNQVKY
jgi:hypothetical protein